MSQDFIAAYGREKQTESLGPVQRRNLAFAVMLARRTRPDAEEKVLQDFFFPLCQASLTLAQLAEMFEKVPIDWALDHRTIYYDFRLSRWMRILEPPTLDECLQEYLESAPVRGEALARIAGECKEFFNRHGGAHFVTAKE